VRLAESLYRFLTVELGHDEKAVAEMLGRDWRRGGRPDHPEFLRTRRIGAEPPRSSSRRNSLPKRQARHGAVS
jgi:hypothetical protein